MGCFETLDGGEGKGRSVDGLRRGGSNGDVPKAAIKYTPRTQLMSHRR